MNLPRPCVGCLLHNIIDGLNVCGSTILLKYKKDGILFVDGIPENVKCAAQMNRRELKAKRRKVYDNE